MHPCSPCSAFVLSGRLGPESKFTPSPDLLIAMFKYFDLVYPQVAIVPSKS